MDLFDATDFWFWYEWQVQSSGHIYGFLWCSMALKPDTSTYKLRKAFAEYWATFISVLNPDQFRPPDF